MNYQLINIDLRLHSAKEYHEVKYLTPFLVSDYPDMMLVMQHISAELQPHLCRPTESGKLEHIAHLVTAKNDNKDLVWMIIYLDADSMIRKAPMLIPATELQAELNCN